MNTEDAPATDRIDQSSDDQTQGQTTDERASQGAADGPDSGNPALAPGRRDVLRAIGGTAVAGLVWSSTASAAGAAFGDGVNLQPSYFCDGDQELGWDLMNQYEDIQSVRIEIEPFWFDEIATTREDAKRWIDEADANGYDVVATYHHYPDNGAQDAGALQNAAEFWVEHYQYLSQDSSFTINLMNEWGNHQVSADEYASAYDETISTVRSGTSYTGSIICDAPGWGQGTHVIADAAPQIGDDDLILSAHVYGDGWNEVAGENFQPEHLDVMDETDYPCMIGEFGSRREGPVDWAAIIEHAHELGWPVFAWAWNGDGNDPQKMNLANPYWGNDCSATSYETSPYFDEIYPYLRGGKDGSGTGGTGGSGSSGSGDSGGSGTGGSGGSGSGGSGGSGTGDSGGSGSGGSGGCETGTGGAGGFDGLWGSGGSDGGSGGFSWWGSSGGGSDGRGLFSWL